MDNQSDSFLLRLFFTHPARFFWGCAIVYAVAWTIIPTLVMPNFRLDVVEQFFVGKEWVFASGKHPALTANSLDLVSRFSGIEMAPWLIQALFDLLALWSIWRFALEFLRPLPALASTLAMFCYWYILPIEGYNNSVTLDTFWIFAILLSYWAIASERLRYWIAAGAAIGIGLYFKYTEIILALIIVLFLISNRQKRFLWGTPGPWVSIVTALIVFAPYICWTIKTGYFGSISYAVGSAPQQSGWSAHILAPLGSIIQQIPLLFAPIVCLMPILRLAHRNHAIGRREWKYSFLNWVFWGPIIFNLVWSAVGGVFLRSALGCHLWMPLTIWLLVFAQKGESVKALEQSCSISIFVNLSILAGFCIVIPLVPLLDKTVPRYYYPGQAIAAKADEIWNGNASVPLPWVTSGDYWWPAGNVSLYSNDRPRVYPGPAICTWADRQDVADEGGLFVWESGSFDEEILSSMKTDFPTAEVVGIYSFKPDTRFVTNEVKVGFALIPPKK